MSDWYILNERSEAVKADVIEFSKWLESNSHRKIVGKTYVGDLHISTVFLGLDHSWHGPPPVLFETMIFGEGKYDEYQERYETCDQAVRGHERCVRAVINGEDLL